MSLMAIRFPKTDVFLIYTLPPRNGKFLFHHTYTTTPRIGDPFFITHTLPSKSESLT